MKLGQLPLRALFFHRRLHRGALLGTALAATVLTGALLVGVSVRHSLREAAAARLGSITHAMESGTRFLAEDVAPKLEDRLGAPVAPLLQARAVALRRGRDGKVLSATGVRLYGIDERFLRFLPPGPQHPALSVPGEGEVLINRRLARELGASPGDVVTLRIGRATVMPLDAPLAARSDRLTRLGSFTVAAVATAAGLGNFNLRAEQVPPANVFVGLKWLQSALERRGRTNLLVTGGGSAVLATERVNGALAGLFDPGDAGYRLRRDPGRDVVQLESERVFIDPAVGELALGLPGGSGSLAWLVDSLTKREGGVTAATPYSFVVAAAPSLVPGVSPVPAGMGNHEIILNAWTAAQLQAERGDSVTLEYSMPTPGGAFLSRSRSFRVHSVMPMDRAEAEKLLVPSFPGLTDADTCGDWDIGMPLDEEKLADKPNEEYWRLYRQTPKAFITLAAGRELWSSRWGDLTAVRYPAEGAGAVPAPALTALSVDPASVGFVFQPTAEQAARAVRDSIDFGGLFLGMSLFLIAAALALAGMLHLFAVQQRRGEIGTLRALGFSVRQVTALFFTEMVLVALAGAVAGSLSGSLYTRALLQGLGSLWREAVAGTAVGYHGSAAAVAIGAAGAFVMSLASLSLTLRSLGGRQAHELISGGGSRRARGRPAAAAAIGTLLAAVAVSRYALASQRSDPAGLFFLAGALLLTAFLCGLRWIMATLDRPVGTGLTPGTFALRNVLRRPGRSLSTAGIFACGCFIVIAVSSMRTDASGQADLPWSGTGGFRLYGETVLPLPAEALSISVGANGHRDGSLGGFAAVPFKVRDGDDASCFNLNRAQTPRLLGVDPALLTARRSFVPPDSEKPVWSLLRHELPGDVVPGLAGDGDTALWNLALKTGVADGDELEYVDEWGRAFKVRIVGALPVRKSVLQGSIIISDAAFARRFPSEGGYRMFLLDEGRTTADAAYAQLENAFADFGLDLSPAADRLRSFYAVEHAYLDMFLLLGGLGLMLASLGMGVVVMRNLAERRAEHALLEALGFSRRFIGRLLFLEHAGLFCIGLAGGACAALLAVTPLLLRSRAGFSWTGLALLLAGLVTAGLTLIFFAEKSGGRRSPLPALRDE